MFTWVVVSLIFRYSSLSSMFSSLTVLVVTFFRENVAKSMIKVSNCDFQKTIFESNEIVEVANN